MGITLRTIYQDTNEYDDGRIIKQSRKAGELVVKGASLTVTVARNAAIVEDEEDDCGGFC